MNVYFLFAVTLEGVTNDTAAHTVDGVKVLKDGYSIATLDRCYWRHSVKMQRNDDGVERISTTVRIRYAFCVDGKAIFPAHGIKLSKTANFFTEILRRKLMLSDTIESFELDKSVRIRL